MSAQGAWTCSGADTVIRLHGAHEELGAMLGSASGKAHLCLDDQKAADEKQAGCEVCEVHCGFSTEEPVSADRLIPPSTRHSRFATSRRRDRHAQSAPIPLTFEFSHFGSFFLKSENIILSKPLCLISDPDVTPRVSLESSVTTAGTSLRRAVIRMASFPPIVPRTHRCIATTCEARQPCVTLVAEFRHGHVEPISHRSAGLPRDGGLECTQERCWLNGFRK